MAEALLYKCVSGEVDLNQISQWILNNVLQDDFVSNCSPGDFISFLLNFIHAEAPCSSKQTCSRPPHYVHTPKSIRKQTEKVNSSNVKRRPALFEPKYRQDVKGVPPPASPDNNRNIKSIVNTSFQQNNVSIMSPVSPLYNVHKSGTRLFRQSTPVHEKSLCLGDFITITPARKNTSSAKKKAQKSLIDIGSERKPLTLHTTVNTVNSNSYNFTENSYTDKDLSTLSTHDSIPTRTTSDLTSNRSFNDILTTQSTAGNTVRHTVTIQPDPKLVRCPRALDILATLYAFALEHHLVLSVVSELYFVLSLLLCEQSVSDVDGSRDDSGGDSSVTALSVTASARNMSQVFESLHDSVYFGGKVLSAETVLRLLRVFDSATLRHLRECDRVREVGGVLKRLDEICEGKKALCDDSTDPSYDTLYTPLTTPSSTAPPPNVCFISDTDGRDNFPTDAAFHAFRKQRDLFYDIVRVWEQQQRRAVATTVTTTQWCFAEALGGRIRTLVGLGGGEPANYRHLARLFKGQLLNACLRTTSVVLDDTSMPEELLATLPNIDAQKLNRLRSRFVTRHTGPSGDVTHSGNAGNSGDSALNAPPSFPGYQEFYRDFLGVVAVQCAAAFLRHVRDALTAELVLLNGHTGGVGVDAESTDAAESSGGGDKESSHNEIENSVDSTTRKSFYITLRSVRLLAKFLGYLDSMPYASRQRSVTMYSSDNSDKIAAAELAVRFHQQPDFNIIQLVQKAIVEHRLVLTLPWVVEYIAILDKGSIILPYYQQLFEILFTIYHKIPTNEPLNRYNNDLIRLTLGWLFELPQFPSECYYAWWNTKKSYSTTLPLSNDIQVTPTKTCNKENIFGNTANNENSLNTIRKSCTTSESFGLDDLDLVDEGILYGCCPYLGEFRRLLRSNRQRPVRTVKHITPVSASLGPGGYAEIAEKRLKAQLEEAFFNAQPASMRKTVEFVSERIASNCVKIICSKIVPEYKKSALVDFKLFMSNLNVNGNGDDEKENGIYRNKLANHSRDFLQRSLQYLQILCGTETRRMIANRVPVAIEVLLTAGDDALPQTRVTCASIASRICYERVQRWLQTHINAAIFAKDFDSEVERIIYKYQSVPENKLTFVLPSAGNSAIHNDNTLSAVQIVELLRNYCVNILEKSPIITNEMILDIIRESVGTITERCDVNDCILHTINHLFLDLYLLILTHLSNNTTHANASLLTPHLIKFWLLQHEDSDAKSRGESIFNGLCSARNIKVLSQAEAEVAIVVENWAQSNDYRTTVSDVCCSETAVVSVTLKFKTFGVFIGQLLNAELITCAEVESQLEAIWHIENWDMKTRNRISITMKAICNEFYNQQTSDNKFVFLLDFI